MKFYCIEKRNLRAKIIVDALHRYKEWMESYVAYDEKNADYFPYSVEDINGLIQSLDNFLNGSSNDIFHPSLCDKTGTRQEIEELKGLADFIYKNIEEKK